MRIVRNTLLLAGAALAALAMTATPVAAQETGVEVVHETTGNACAPCTLHLEGEAQITALPSGVVVSGCESEYEGVINHNGTGEVEWVGGPHGGPGCNIVNCTGAEGHWPLSTLGETSAGEEHTVLRFCLSSGAELHCDRELRIADTGAHAYEFAFHTLCAGGAREVEGESLLESTNHDSIELIHH